MRRKKKSPVYNPFQKDINQQRIRKICYTEKTVPVFIAYFTSWVDRSGKLNVHDDKYNRDERLGEVLFL